MRSTDSRSASFKGIGTVPFHFGSAAPQRRAAKQFDGVRMARISKLFTSLPGRRRGRPRKQIDLTKPAEVENEAKIAFPTHDGRPNQLARSMRPPLRTFRVCRATCRPRRLLNPYRDYGAVNAAEFLGQHQLAHPDQARGRSTRTGGLGFGLLDCGKCEIRLPNAVASTNRRAAADGRLHRWRSTNHKQGASCDTSSPGSARRCRLGISRTCRARVEFGPRCET